MTKIKLFKYCTLNQGAILFASVFLTFLVMSSRVAATEASQNPITVSGKVIDENDETIIGATIRSSTGGAVATDVNGNFTIKTDDSAVLTVMYLGYVTQEIKVNGRTQINIKLVPSSNQLNDVVVVGYGTQKRKDVTGAITTIKFEEGPKSAVPFVNALEALQGASGINVGPSTSAGATPSIVVRGQNSINGSGSPLIVLDGVIFNGNINEINMNDVATYDILKDASAASIYGSRSQNGVVLITTKRGKTDKPTINFNTYYGVQNWTRVPEMRSGEDFLQWRKDNLSIRGIDITDMTKVLTPLEMKAYNAGQNLNWLDEVTQYAPIQNYEMSVSGRTEKLNYYFSAGYLNQKGVLYNDKFIKPNLTIKLENTITDWLSYGVNGYYSTRDYSGISPNLYMATYMSPYSYRYLEGSNNEILERFPSGSTSLFNPFWGNPVNSQLPGAYDDDLERSGSLRGTGFLNVKIPFVKGLNFRFDATGDRRTSEKAYFHHEFGEVDTSVPGDLANPLKFLPKANGYRTNSLSSSWLINNLLTYTKSFGGHNFDVLLGYTRDAYKIESLRFNASDFSKAGTTTLGYNALHLGALQTGTTAIEEYANIGYISRLNYNYKQRYYATFNYRRDGYSAFAQGHKYGSFPGGSIAWAMSEEGFMKGNTIFNYLKARVSYGRTGNQGIDPYSTLANVTAGNTVFGSVTTPFSNPANLANKEFTWEKTTALNFGVDFSLFSDRVSGNVDVYQSNTVDQLLTRYIPIFTGYNSVVANLGEVQNRGIEITINTHNIKSPSGFSWDTGVSFWMNRNKLVHLTGLDVDQNGVEDNDVANSLFIGKSLGAIFDYTVDGVVQSSDTEYMNRYRTPAGGALFIPGDLKIRDLNNDGIIGEADKSIIGYNKENFNFNVSNTLSYKNFQLFFSVNAIVGGGKDNFFMSTNLRGLNPAATLPSSGNWLNLPYWTPTNENNQYPRPNYNNTYGYGFYQSRTFVRLQTASLSYSFPKSMTESLNINNLKVYVSGTNLFTLTDWTGLDPANAGQIGGNGGSSNSAVNTSNPLMRTISFGLNLGF